MTPCAIWRVSFMHKLTISTDCAVSLCCKHYSRPRLDKDGVYSKRSKSTVWTKTVFTASVASQQYTVAASSGINDAELLDSPASFPSYWTYTTQCIYIAYKNTHIYTLKIINRNPLCRLLCYLIILILFYI